MPWPEISHKSIEKTLRNFESDRSTRCARIVAMSRQGNDRLLKLPLGVRLLFPRLTADCDVKYCETCTKRLRSARQFLNRFFSMQGVVIRNMKARFAPYFSKHQYDYMLWDPPALIHASQKKTS